MRTSIRTRYAVLIFVLALWAGFAHADVNQESTTISELPDESNEGDAAQESEKSAHENEEEERLRQKAAGLDGDWEFLSEYSDGSWYRKSLNGLLIHIDTSTGKPEVTKLKRIWRGRLPDYEFVFSLQHFQEFGEDLEKLVIDCKWTVIHSWTPPFTDSNYSRFEITFIPDTLIIGDTEIDGFVGELYGGRYRNKGSIVETIARGQRIALVRTRDISGMRIDKKEVFLLSERQDEESVAADGAQLSEEEKRIGREGEEFIGKWEFIKKGRSGGWYDAGFFNINLVGTIRIRNDITSIEPKVKSLMKEFSIKYEKSDEDDSSGRWVMTGYDYSAYGSAYSHVDVNLVFDTITLKGKQVNAFVGTLTTTDSRPYGGLFSFDRKPETIKTKEIALIKVE